MHLTAYNITYILSNIFTAYIVKLFMDKYLGISNKHKKNVYFAYGLFSLITTAIYFIFDRKCNFIEEKVVGDFIDD